MPRTARVPLTPTSAPREVGVLVSVNVDVRATQLARTHRSHWVWKRSVPGPRMVRRLNVDGDGQGTPSGTADPTVP